jgi:hypothetical protein
MGTGPSVNDSVRERGVALVAALLIMMLMSALMVGFTTVVMSDSRYRGLDKDRTRVFYAAHSGIEKLTADLRNLFFANVDPTPAQIAALSSNPPIIPEVTFTAPAGINAYGATQRGDDVKTQILSGPYQGLLAMKDFYDLDVVARTLTGSEAHLTRRVETVLIPVFQFGMFSDVDLSFSAAADMDFGGRVHTNGNLFLSQGGTFSSTLTLRDKVTAVKEIVRQRLSNANSIDNSGSTRTVKVATSTNTLRDLARTEGSVTDGLNPLTLNNNWTTLSLSTYNGYIRNGRTGAKPLNLPLITMGQSNIASVARPAADPVTKENVANPTLFAQRYYGKVSLRILLSDKDTDITNLPTVDTTKPPVKLDNNWNTTPPTSGVTYGPINASHPPVARSLGHIATTTTASTAVNAATIAVASIPAIYRTPPLTVGPGSVPVTCTGRTLTTFTGCTVPTGSALSSGWTISATSSMPGNGVVTATLNGGVSAGSGKTLTVNAGQTTAAFAANSFFLNGALVTCMGHTGTTQFDLCTGTPATTYSAGNPPVVATGYLSAQDTGTIGGYIKIEMQDAGGVWKDVTMEILNWGISGPNLTGAACGDPTPNAIIRIQRLRDNGNAATCTYAGSVNAADHWPNVLFDAREAVQRDLNPGTTNLILSGVMHYITLDVANLSKWFKGTAPYNGSSGVSARTDVANGNGYSVYFSDRRNNRDAANLETGEYGFEDYVNPASPTGVPNGTLDAGEDVNANNALDTYGQFPSYEGVANTLPPGAAGVPAPFNSSATVRPTQQINAGQAKVNRAYLFRRALKLVNGSLGNIVEPGLTIATENPVYLQGDWNANPAGFGDPHVATSIIADAVTLLSNSWNDVNSFGSPYSTAGRQRAAHSYYRVAIIAGKGPTFQLPTGTAQTTFGTDGGAHSFLRMLEGNSAATVHYRGSMVTFFYNRQAVGTFKCCNNIEYDTPTRDFQFDTDFLDLAKLPPLTPMFRDLNALGFSQELRPGK